ncbi:hypothetical protein Gohar_028354 [Gossypium harknessii]|uniref:RNase H type-1 domain-containing protein n=1 Tax=Gossypium harknessii TaxID=34285 RepID=A0A7J9IH14_9ROSI|nr:hypothetical protein [Gossypium harknessii]
MFEDEHALGIGVIICDIRGHLIKGLTGFERASCSPKIVEAFAIKEALSWLKFWHLDHVVVESDYMSIVHALNRSVVNDSKSSCLISDCLVLGSSFQHLSFCWVRWLANRELIHSVM